LDACIRLGVDHVGLNFVPSSPRHVDFDTARRLTDRIGGRLPVVGVFKDQSIEEIEEALRQVPLDAIQLHGKESPGFCARVNRPVWKVFSVGRGWDPSSVLSYSGAAVHLFDSAGSDGSSGGTGKTFDWSLLPTRSSLPWYLAGGLCAENIPSAITLHRPDGLDLNSGVESSPGVKDPRKLEAAMEIVSAWRTQAVVVGLPGRPGEWQLVEGEKLPCWKVSSVRESPETEIRGLMDLLAIHGRLVLDLTARTGDVQQVAIELMHWQMIARERGNHLMFKLGEEMVDAVVRSSLGGLLELVD
jgi:phosphoribosylanthranilate isomerase